MPAERHFTDEARPAALTAFTAAHPGYDAAAIAELRANLDTQFDRATAETFLAILPGLTGQTPSTASADAVQGGAAVVEA